MDREPSITYNTNLKASVFDKAVFVNKIGRLPLHPQVYAVVIKNEGAHKTEGAHKIWIVTTANAQQWAPKSRNQPSFGRGEFESMLRAIANARSARGIVDADEARKRLNITGRQLTFAIFVFRNGNWYPMSRSRTWTPWTFNQT